MVGGDSDAGAPDVGVPDGGARDAEGVDAAPSFDAGPPDAGVDQAVGDSFVPQPGTWVTIPAGTFMMGSAGTEACGRTNEDLHQVTLTRSFEISSTEVTQAQFESLMGYNPSNFKSCGTNCPVERVSWHEAVAYCNALSSQKGHSPCYTCTGSGTSVTCQEAAAYGGANIYSCPGYRLPTEAEWEYAYRTETQTAYYSGASDPAACGCQGNAKLEPIAWYCGKSGSTTHPVGQKQPNAWHLYDMAGNIWEWCHDWYGSYPSTSVTDPVGASGSDRVLRGGSWNFNARNCRAAHRGNSSPGARYGILGFRLARSVP